MIITQFVLSFLKNNWQTLAIASLLVAWATTSKCQSSAYQKDIKALQEQHTIEIDALKKAHDIEVQSKIENERRLQTRLQEIQSQFDTAQQRLDQEKKTQVAEIVKKYGDDPDELTRQIGELTGFTVIMPKE